MAKKQKLELTWIGKENRAKLEPRILLEDPSKSYHAEHRVSDKDIFDNKLIFGDNLLAGVKKGKIGQVSIYYSLVIGDKAEKLKIWHYTL